VVDRSNHQRGWSVTRSPGHCGERDYAYNSVGVQRSYVGAGIGRGGNVTLYLDGQQVGEGGVERTHKFFFSMDETMDIGSDAGAPVSEGYGPRGSDFNGKINWVQIDVDQAAEDADHLITADELFNLAMAKQ